MPYDMNSQLWPNLDEVFFRDRELRVIRQTGPHCVSTSLAILTGATPEEFQGVVNTQDPTSWSDKIRNGDYNLRIVLRTHENSGYTFPSFLN
jgi:hypothetical protein